MMGVYSIVYRKHQVKFGVLSLYNRRDLNVQPDGKRNWLLLILYKIIYIYLKCCG